MRFTLLALFIGFFLSNPVAVAQNFPFVDGMEVKTYHNHANTGPYNRGITYKLIGDTLIQGKLYHQIYKIEECYWDGFITNYYSDELTYMSAVRADSTGNIYHFPINFSNEILTTDFSLQVGDTAQLWAFSFIDGFAYAYPNGTVVTAADSLANYGNRRRIQFYVDNGFLEFVEGYSDTRGFLPTGDPELTQWSNNACVMINNVQMYDTIGSPWCYTCTPPGGNIAIEAIWPEPYTSTIYYCDQNIAPIFEFANAGADTIYSLAFNYGDDIAGGTYSWTGTLAPLDSYIDTLDSYTTNDGVHELSIGNGLTVNGSYDSNPDNNLLYDTFLGMPEVYYTVTTSAPHPITIYVQPDVGGMEVSFEAMPIIDSSWNGGGENFAFHNSVSNTNYWLEYEMCLNDDCFDFGAFVNQGAGWATALTVFGDTIFDGYLDGTQQNPLSVFCADSVYLNGNVNVNGNGNGNFSNLPIPTYSLLYPNPTTGSIYLSSRTPPNMTEGNLYRIFSVDGRQVAKGRLDNDAVDVSQLSTGVYVIRILNLDANTIDQELKFVKK
jgi:hypothetical protein